MCFRLVARVRIDMEVSWNRGTPKSSILIEFSIMNHPFWGILHSCKPSYTEKFFSKARSLQLDRSALRHVFLGAQTDGAEDMWAPSSPIFFVGAPDPDLDVIHMKDLLGTPVGDVSIANTPFGLRMDYIYIHIHRVIFIHIYIYLCCTYIQHRKCSFLGW